MPNDLKVSVIIPTYGRPDSLSNCLSSLENQTFPPHEVIVVVDGGITTEVQAVIDRFKNNSKLNLVQINNSERKGALVSRRIGLKIAAGDIITYLDDDVVLEPNWMAEILKGYQDNEEAVGVGGIIVDPVPYRDNVFYRLFARVRSYLFRSKMGKINFIGLPYAYLTAPADGYLSVDFLNSGNSSYRREIIMSIRPDRLAGVDCVEEHNLGIILTREEKKKLIYNSKAVAYHHLVRSGGSWVGERDYYILRDHVTYLLKDFNLKYVRLALFSLYILALCLLFQKPKYLNSISEGMRQYKDWKRGLSQASV
ncbi:glycosyltransferase family A protein [Chloroflexota bacterium]